MQERTSNPGSAARGSFLNEEPVVQHVHAIRLSGFTQARKDHT